MARDFPGATSSRISAGAAVVSGLPLTMVCWYNADNLAANHLLVGVFDTTGSGGHYLVLQGSGDPVNAFSFAGTDWVSSTSGASSTGTWYHAAGVYASATSRIAYQNGSAGTADTNSRAPSPNQTHIGVYEVWDGLFSPMNGKIAEVAIWDVALTPAEISILAAGFSPLFVRPANLIAYAPLIGRTSPEIDKMGGATWTIAGSPVASEHPRIIYPAVPAIIVAPAVADGFVPYPRYSMTGGMQEM